MTSLSLTLPQAEFAGPCRAPAVSTRTQQELPRLDGISVLVVDDERDARRLMKRFLEARGATVSTAGSADEAIDVLCGDGFDVLLSDIGMPEQDGYDLIRRVRRMPAEEGGGTPAAAVTAFARDDDRRRALVSGYQMHLTKPVDPRALLQAVADLAGRAFN